MEECRLRERLELETEICERMRELVEREKYRIVVRDGEWREDGDQRGIEGRKGVEELEYCVSREVREGRILRIEGWLESIVIEEGVIGGFQEYFFEEIGGEGRIGRRKRRYEVYKERIGIRVRRVVLGLDEG